jgi:alginate O-acetyltransferase complex protein AlgI
MPGAVADHAATATAFEALLAMYGFPTAADSIVDLWRRWHKTLSFWLRDYLYIPLGGNRDGKVYEIRNIMITMALGGLWHGASWTFVIWGILHGAAVSAVHAARKLLRWSWLDRVPRWVGVLVTFNFVTLVWVFFRAPGLGHATDLLRAVVTGGWDGTPRLLTAHLFEIMLIALFLAFHRYDDHRRVRIAVARLRPEILRPLLLAQWALAITVSQAVRRSSSILIFDGCPGSCCGDDLAACWSLQGRRR